MFDIIVHERETWREGVTLEGGRIILKWKLSVFLSVCILFPSPKILILFTRLCTSLKEE